MRERAAHEVAGGGYIYPSWNPSHLCGGCQSRWNPISESDYPADLWQMS